MIAVAAASGRPLKVFENFVFYPPLVRARALLREGAIGWPLHFRMKVVMADRAQAWHVPESASRWRHALAAEGRGGPMVFDHGHHMMAVALWLFGEVRDGFACIERTETPVGVYDAPATLMWQHTNPPVHGTWDVSLALKMTLRTDYYADAERFEIQGEEGIIQVTRCSDRMLDEQARAVRSGPQPVVVGLAENPKPGKEGITTWKASDALALCAVGLISGSMIFSCSITEPGHPCVTMSGNAFSCFERT
jgi:predicted dehydrogenase